MEEKNGQDSNKNFGDNLVIKRNQDSSRNYETFEDDSLQRPNHGSNDEIYSNDYVNEEKMIQSMIGEERRREEKDYSISLTE